MTRKILISCLLVLTGIVRAFTTPQSPDYLIYNGDTIPVHSLSLPVEFCNAEYILFGGKYTGWSTDCGRGYMADWEIVDSFLYLTGIYSCGYSQDVIQADLNALFKGRVDNGKVKADWITGKAFSPQGERLRYEHGGIGGFYERELELYFEKGKLISTRLYDNTKYNRTSIYVHDKEKFNEFIYSNVRWDLLPLKDTAVRVIIGFVPDENGKINDVQLMRGGKSEKIFDEEAVRVIKLIPEWEVFFSREEAVRMRWIQPITFTKENREKYGK
ncbi:energy transducer TonB [Porphyromonadaceae bacterium OttesenSCG-928-L07]|nr:energy transducer TonB [Porphyromonadaceae bacterium OttesenSCG-928-L07]MDL2252114.1 energy transducer TonB [Odoribacter sp. OttesenSCG-928-J03]MDL2330952.1 energy transducer TonB [Odoribacter sp. OttesenSCG-928-A06]